LEILSVYVTYSSCLNNTVPVCSSLTSS